MKASLNEYKTNIITQPEMLEESGITLEETLSIMYSTLHSYQMRLEV
jgi:hypothetical protein